MLFIVKTNAGFFEGDFVSINVKQCTFVSLRKEVEPIDCTEEGNFTPGSYKPLTQAALIRFYLKSIDLFKKAIESSEKSSHELFKHLYNQKRKMFDVCWKNEAELLTTWTEEQKAYDVASEKLKKLQQKLFPRCLLVEAVANKDSRVTAAVKGSSVDFSNKADNGDAVQICSDCQRQDGYAVANKDFQVTTLDEQQVTSEGSSDAADNGDAVQNYSDCQKQDGDAVASKDFQVTTLDAKEVISEGSSGEADNGKAVANKDSQVTADEAAAAAEVERSCRYTLFKSIYNENKNVTNLQEALPEDRGMSVLLAVHRRNVTLLEELVRISERTLPGAALFESILDVVEQSQPGIADPTDKQLLTSLLSLKPKPSFLHSLEDVKQLASHKNRQDIVEILNSWLKTNCPDMSNSLSLRSGETLRPISPLKGDVSNASTNGLSSLAQATTSSGGASPAVTTPRKVGQPEGDATKPGWFCC